MNSAYGQLGQMGQAGVPATAPSAAAVQQMQPQVPAVAPGGAGGGGGFFQMMSAGQGVPQFPQLAAMIDMVARKLPWWAWFLGGALVMRWVSKRGYLRQLARKL